MREAPRARKAAGALTLFAALLAACSWPAQSIPRPGGAHKQTPPAGAQKNQSSFVSDDKSFSISMPGTPKREDIKTPSSFGPVVMIMYQVELRTSAYSLGYTDFPKDKIAHVSAEKILTMSSDGVHKRYGKGVIKDEKITYHGFPGRAIVCRMDAPAKVQMDMRAILVKNRLYTMSLVHLQSDPMTGEITHFLESFKLLK